MIVPQKSSSSSSSSSSSTPKVPQTRKREYVSFEEEQLEGGNDGRKYARHGDEKIVHGIGEGETVDLYSPLSTEEVLGSNEEDHPRNKTLLDIEQKEIGKEKKRKASLQRGATSNEKEVIEANVGKGTSLGSGKGSGSVSGKSGSGSEGSGKSSGNTQISKVIERANQVLEVIQKGNAQTAQPSTVTPLVPDSTMRSKEIELECLIEKRKILELEAAARENRK